MALDLARRQPIEKASACLGEQRTVSRPAMDAYNQEHRLLRIDTVLGKDHVLLVSLRGRDASRPASSTTWNSPPPTRVSPTTARHGGHHLAERCRRPERAGERHHRRVRHDAAGRSRPEHVSPPSGAEFVAAHPHQRLPHLPGQDRPADRRSGAVRFRRKQEGVAPERRAPEARLLRAVPRDRARLHLPPAGGGRHLLLLPPRRPAATPWCSATTTAG